MNNLLEQVFLQVNIGIIVIDREYQIVLSNNFATDYTKKTSAHIFNNNLFDVYSELPKDWLKRRIDNIFLLKNSSFIRWEQRPYLFNFESSRPITSSNATMLQNCALLPIVDNNHNVTHVCITVNDVTSTAATQIQLRKTSERLSTEKEAQYKLIKKLEETKNQLLQSEKMASIGQLAAGVAHEINNPVGFIKSNFSSLKRYAETLKLTLNAYNELIETQEDDKMSERANLINDENDIDFVTEDIANLLADSFDGISRIEEIVKSLQLFARADTNQWEEADINQGIESTLKVVAHQLKYIAEVKTSFGDLPLIQCLPMQVNQVFMNLLVNAGHAIDKDNKTGKIVITTERKESDVVITISDNGKGITEEDQIKIFDPFFTTKPVGEGTGLGLSLSYNIIKKHNGHITVDSTVGSGTKFTVTLPIEQ